MKAILELIQQIPNTTLQSIIVVGAGMSIVGICACFAQMIMFKLENKSKIKG